ncbi:unnamed protein product [Brassica napus]|uniref:(rape) hypothetical protein n=1 Tax=Brassica napus TaxID=3708 RepID=A0A816IVY2_BRANA|nr:unnamed protein product [Brassica napus]
MGDYLIKEASMLMTVRDEVEELKTELTCIHCYLRDVEAREREDEVSKEWSDDIRSLKRRLVDITRKRQTYGVGRFKEVTSSRVRQLRRARPVDHEELVVGFEDDVKFLLAKLLDDEGERYIISIFGMGGLGKTALARKLYNLGDVKRRFEYRAWTYVSQDYNTRDMLLRIIRSLGVASGEELERIKILKRALPCNHGESRVIITTRIKAVAEGVDGRVYVHKLRFLTFEESWKLFDQKAFMNFQWVQKCDGRVYTRGWRNDDGRCGSALHRRADRHKLSGSSEERKRESGVLREVVHHLMDNNYLCDRRVNKRMRSFLFFGEQKGMLGRYIPFMSLPDVICESIHLRYLGVADTGLRHLPSPISNLEFLQTLDASGNRFEGMTDLRKLTSLRHLMGRFIGELLIGDAVNLQTLRSISSYSWSKIQCKSLKNLRDLEIYDSGYVELTRVRLNLSSFSNLTNLRALTLRVPTFRISSEAVVFHMDVFFPSLESLTFSGTNLEEDPMPALQKLPRLEDLVLEDCDCSEVKMSFSAQGFARLRKLALFRVRLDSLWIEEEAMPSLMHLNLVNRLGPRTKMMIPDRFLALVRGY